MVCRSGFATEQQGYDEAQRDLEQGLAEVEARLRQQRFLMGDQFTDADLRLFPTIARYDAVYNSFFRCTRRRIAADFPNLQAWMQDVWLLPCSGALRVCSHPSCVSLVIPYFWDISLKDAPTLPLSCFSTRVALVPAMATFVNADAGHVQCRSGKEELLRSTVPVESEWDHPLGSYRAGSSPGRGPWQGLTGQGSCVREGKNAGCCMTCTAVLCKLCISYASK
jgi:hypothetical protein